MKTEEEIRAEERERCAKVLDKIIDELDKKMEQEDGYRARLYGLSIIVLYCGANEIRKLRFPTEMGGG